MKAMWTVLAMALAGCAGLESPDPASPYYAYPPGWVVQVNRPLLVEPGAATVRLQYGLVVPRNSVQEHDPFCVVELDTVRPAPQTLPPGRFPVWQVIRSVSPIAAAAKSPLLKTHDGTGDGDPSFLYFITEFRLRHAGEPALRSVRCAWNQMAPGNRMLMRHLTLDEIRYALGDWVTLVPPGEML